MATNPLDKLSLSQAQLENIAGGGTETSGSDSYTADETALYLTPEVVDTTPTQNSTNTITSGGVYNAIQHIAKVELLETITLTEATASLQFGEHTGQDHWMIWVNHSDVLGTGTVTIRIDYADNTYDTVELSVSSSQKRFIVEVKDLGPIKTIEGSAGNYLGLLTSKISLPIFLEKNSTIKKITLTGASNFPSGVVAKLYCGVTPA